MNVNERSSMGNLGNLGGVTGESAPLVFSARVGRRYVVAARVTDGVLICPDCAVKLVRHAPLARLAAYRCAACGTWAQADLSEPIRRRR